MRELLRTELRTLEFNRRLTIRVRLRLDEARHQG
jgi:hypothetical protein